MKGVQLATNTMIVLMIAVIVLLALVVFFYTTWSPTTGGLAADNAKTFGCHKITSINCIDSSGNKIDPDNVEVDYDVDGDGTNDSLGDLFDVVYNVHSDDEIRRICGCSPI